MQQCFISKKMCPNEDVVNGGEIGKTLFAYIKNRYPDFTEDSYLSREELSKVRGEYIGALLQNEIGDLSALEKDVINSIGSNEILSENVEAEEDKQSTFGERIADKVAGFGGSWTFIIVFFLILFGWMVLNVVFLRHKAYDPYPFILLNLILSCLAAIQAPIIMMSQNRQEDKDRARSEHDYKVNLKAELEIRMLHEKIDHLLIHQNQRLLEIQRVQVEMMESIDKRLQESNKSRRPPIANDPASSPL